MLLVWFDLDSWAELMEGLPPDAGGVGAEFSV